jgi:hypothetical protein
LWRTSKRWILRVLTTRWSKIMCHSSYRWLLISRRSIWWRKRLRRVMHRLVSCTYRFDSFIFKSLLI